MKIQERMKRISHVTDAYYCFDSMKLTIYYDNSKNREEVRFQVLDAIPPGLFDANGSIQTISFILDEDKVPEGD
jgi:hypothetical protein